MKSRSFSVCLLLISLLAACAPATVAAPTATSTPVPPTATPTLPADAHGSYERIEITSTSLANNLIGESPTHSFYVYLPPTYAISSRHYPVVFYLPGYTDREMLNVSLPRGIDDVIRGGAISEMIIVVVSGVNRLGGSFYVNSEVTGNWEDFIALEVVNYVDVNYRTIPEAASRGISGHSMGGFGALNIAMHRPDIFGAVYSMSPGLFDPDGLAESQMFNTDSLIQRFLKYRTKIEGLPTEDVQTSFLGSPDNFTLAYGLAFAPNVEKPPYFDYPYSGVNDALVRDEATWKKWESGYGGIAEEIEQYKSNLLSLKGIVVDVGRYDEYAWIPKGCDYFDEQLTAAAIPHMYDKYDGSHQGNLDERIREFMLPFFSTTLEFE